MAVTLADIKAPTGEVESWLFPRELDAAVDARLTAYLEEGEAKVADTDYPNPDAIVTAWAYFRVYDAVYLRLTTNASTRSLADQGSQQWTTAQIDAVRARRDAKLALIPAELRPEPPVENVDNAPANRAQTHGVRNTFFW